VSPADLRARGIDLAGADAGSVLVTADAEAALVGIFDGASSWGFGVEAARWTRDRMALAWGSPSALTPSALVDDLRSLVEDVPPEWNGELGWSFALVVALVSRRGVTLVAAGYYAATLLRGAAPVPILAPRTLADELVANGTISLDRADEVPEVCVGPYFGEEGAAADLRPLDVPLEGGDRLVVAKEDVMRLVSPDLDAWVTRGADAIRGLGAEERRGTAPVLVVERVPEGRRSSI